MTRGKADPIASAKKSPQDAVRGGANFCNISITPPKIVEIRKTGKYLRHLLFDSSAIAKLRVAYIMMWMYLSMFSILSKGESISGGLKRLRYSIPIEMTIENLYLTSVFILQCTHALRCCLQRYLFL